MWSCSPAQAMNLISKAVHEGKLSPVFFGSALTNFGVEPFLKKFLQMTPPPTAAYRSDIGVIDPFDDAFLRVCVQDSGEHEQGAPRPCCLHAYLLGQV